MDREIHLENDIIRDPCTTRDELLTVMTRLLRNRIEHLPPGRLYQAILQREKQCPTVVNPTLAIPHAKLGDIRDFNLALAICRDGVEFAPGQRINLVCMIVGPADCQKQYLDVLALLLRFFQEKGSKILKSKDSDILKMMNIAIRSLK